MPDHLLQIIKSLSEDEQKVMDKQLKVVPKSKRPYVLELYSSYKKLLLKDFSDKQIETGLLKILNRKPKMKKNIDNVRLDLKEKLQTVMFHQLPLDTLENKVNKNLKIIEIFIERRLYDEAQQLINKTTKWAQESDMNKCLVELTDWKLYLLGRQSEKKDVDKQCKLIEAINHYQFLYTLELRLKNTFRQLNLIVQKDILLKQAENIAAFKAIYQQSNLEKLPVEEYMKVQYTRIVTWYHRIQTLYYRCMNQLDKAFQYSQNLVRYFENHTCLMKNFEAIYIKSICDFTRTCYLRDEHHTLDNSLEKIRQLYEANSDYNILNISCDIGVLHYINTYQYDKAIELANFMQKEWNTISTKSVDGQLLYYSQNNMLLFWVVCDETKFKYWLQTGLSIPRSHKGRDYYFGIRMFELIDDFEQEKWDGFPKKIESLQKTLQNNQNFNAFEKTVLDYFKKLYSIKFSNKTFSLKEAKKDDLQNKSFQSLKDELQNLEECVNHGEVLLWCESHLQNKSIKEVFEAG